MSADRIRALKEERATLITRMQQIASGAEERNENLNAEEQQEFDRLDGEARDLNSRAKRLEELDGLAGEGQRGTRQIAPGVSTRGDGEGATAAATSYREYMQKRAGISTIDKVVDSDEYREAFYEYLATGQDQVPKTAEIQQEIRALSKATGGAGGNLVPTGFRNELVDALREFGVMRQLATVISTDSGETFNVPSVTTHGVSTWTAENAAITESDEAFGTLSLAAYANARAMKASWQLLQDTGFDLEAYIRAQFGISTGVLENTAYVVGDGVNKPTGITTQTSAGVTLAAGGTTTFGAAGADSLISLKYSVLSPYRRNAAWLMNDGSIAKVAALKDTTNQYIWQPGLTAGAPDTLLGAPLYTDPDVPVMAANAKSVLYGDFSWYWIRDVNGIAIQRLNELFAMNGQTGFIVFHRTDGKLVNTAAVKHLANSAT